MKYSGSNIHISLWQIIKDNRAKCISIVIVFLALVSCIAYFYEINRERLEVFDFELSETNPEIPLIDTVDIQIYHSYKSEFIVTEKNSSVRKLAESSKKKGPALIFDATFSMRKTDTFNPDYHKYFSDLIEIEPADELDLPIFKNPEYGVMTPCLYKYFKEVKFCVYSNQEKSRKGKKRIIESITVIDQDARRTRKHVQTESGDSLIRVNQYLVDIEYSKEVSPGETKYDWANSRFVYSGAKEKVPMAVDYKIRNQSNYNLFFRKIDIDIKNCNHKQITIAFPSSVVFDLITIDPDRRTATSITYTSEESFKELRENGLYINARPLGSSNFIDSRNFILATLIGGLFSIFADLVISILSEYNDRRKKKIREEVNAS